MPFNLWERDLTINVKNFTLEKPENTVFKVKDHKWVDYYRWTYFLPDIKKLNNESVEVSFNTLHCNYNLSININPNNYQKNIDIAYKYNNKFKCVIDIKPDNIKDSITIQTAHMPATNEISLNDLEVWHYSWLFIFWLFLVIAVMIRHIDKKWLLLNNRWK